MDLTREITNKKFENCVIEEDNESLSPKSTSSDYENYIIRARLCKNLSRELQLPEFLCNENDVYEPPKEPGLKNADIIIPSYYKIHKCPNKILEIDYFEIIKDDIRNLRTLNKYQIEYIKYLSHEDKYELIQIFNECINTIRDLL